MPDEPDTQPLPGDGEEPQPTEPQPQPDGRRSRRGRA